MFKNLRNKLILINLGITTFVIVVVFSMIYVISTRTAENRPIEMTPQENIEIDENLEQDENSDDWHKIIIFSVRQEKQSAARQLLVTLIVSGVAIEVMVFLVSRFLADEAIKPIKEAYESQKVFIANASHEIKTPLAAISANLEAADIQDNKWIKNVELETAKLTAINGQLLTLARTDLVTNSEAKLTDLKALTLKTLTRFEPRLNDKKLTRQISLNKKVKINSADFEQVLSILMDNAIKYSDKTIVVKLTEHTLSVENDGAKISAEKLPHIFDRFYQGDKSAEGVGLGLAIAKAVSERNHWRLSAKSDKKTIFTLSF